MSDVPQFLQDIGAGELLPDLSTPVEPLLKRIEREIDSAKASKRLLSCRRSVHLTVSCSFQYTPGQGRMLQTLISSFGEFSSSRGSLHMSGNRSAASRKSSMARQVPLPSSVRRHTVLLNLCLGERYRAGTSQAAHTSLGAGKSITKCQNCLLRSFLLVGCTRSCL
jgi:hypothetical protein